MSDIDVRLEAHETTLTGKWLFQDGQMIADITCRRIEWLIQHNLLKIADNRDGGNWETLYKDPNDGRYWERTYPQGEMQGGGPPILRNISNEEVGTRYAT